MTRRTARAAGELLAGYETFVQEAAHVLVNALDLDARPGPLAAALARLARLHTTRPALAARTADTLRRRLNTATRPGSDAALLRAARTSTRTAGTPPDSSPRPLRRCPGPVRNGRSPGGSGCARCAAIRTRMCGTRRCG
ncbi:hypothetical protein [Streptomyces rapamycinicus]|uniref:hypothetical protein n=1 Tax=Streptomyces rapamycinicus TaxID=1226757 RepID=UPI0032D90A3A